jgi:hypothetical protein
MRTTIVVCAWLLLASSPTTAAQAAQQRTFGTPEEAVRALIDATRSGELDRLLDIFGPEGRALIASSDPATARRNREVFIVAVAEQWRLVDEGVNKKTLVIGHEDWPFPAPLMKVAGGWQFDTAAAKEEVLARRIGRNELAAIDACRAYVTAQRRYAQQGHDGKPAGLYATKFQSDPGKENGLYWPAARGQKRSPLGELIAQAADEGRPLGGDREKPSSFYGYYFKILNAKGGFALVAWPAQYDVTGVMAFVVSQDGIVREKDLGAGTDVAARKMTAYNPDASWLPVIQ